MIVRALRVAELGPFGGGVALEGLRGRLDVLVGPNELGKSSIFRALVTLVSERHTANSAAVRDLRHAGAGAPLIEADIEVGGRRIRVRKRYLAQRQAYLRDLDSGHILRGADAESCLDELLGTAGPAPRGLLWVAQRESFALPSVPAISTNLSQLIEQEAADATGAGLARRVADAVKTALAELQTAQRRQPTGALLAAIRAHEDAQRHLDGARAKVEAARSRRTQLDLLRRDEAALNAEETVRALTQAVTDAERALSDGTDARQKLQAAQQRLDSCAHVERLASEPLAAFDKQCAERDRLTREIEADRLRRDQAATARVAASAALEALDLGKSTLVAEIDSLRLRRRATAAAEAHRKLVELEERARSARAAAAEISQIEAAGPAQAISEADLVRLRSLQAEIIKHESEITAASARVEVSYHPGATERFRTADHAIGDGAILLAQAPLEIDVPGIGTLRILPGRTGLEDTRARVAALRSEQSAVLAAMQVPDLPAAEVALTAARNRTQALATARARLQALAPAGLGAIEDEIARLAAQATEASQDQPSDPLSLAEIDRDLSQMDQRAKALERDLTTARDRAVAGSDALVRLDAVLQAKTTQLEKLADDLGHDPQARRGVLAAAAEAARNALVDAKRDRDAWALRTPDEVSFARIQAELQRARQARETRAARLASIRTDITRLQAELGRDEQDGVEAELAVCEDRLAEAGAAVARLEQEAAALSLLLDKLQSAEAQHRGATLKPLTDRLQPLLARALPEATTELTGVTNVAALTRSGRTEPYTQLSDGTREQLAVLVRLAWAGLLADRQCPVPLVLDDALVYSDDTRLARMFELLAAAGTKHQVLVLSCHEAATRTAAAAVGAHLLQLQPWQAEEIRAA